MRRNDVDRLRRFATPYGRTSNSLWAFSLTRLSCIYRRLSIVNRDHTLGAEMERVKNGGNFQLTPIGRATTSPDGRYALKADPGIDLSEFANEEGYIEVSFDTDTGTSLVTRDASISTRTRYPTSATLSFDFMTSGNAMCGTLAHPAYQRPGAFRTGALLPYLRRLYISSLAGVLSIAMTACASSSTKPLKIPGDEAESPNGWTCLKSQKGNPAISLPIHGIKVVGKETLEITDIELVQSKHVKLVGAEIAKWPAGNPNRVPTTVVGGPLPAKQERPKTFMG